MRILINGINYSPEPIGIGKYTGEMAEWLASRGHIVEAITTMPHYPFWEIPPEYASSPYLVENIRGVRVMRVRPALPHREKIGFLGRVLLETSFSLRSWHFWRSILFKQNQHDMVIAICPPLQVGIYPMIYAQLSKCPWVFHIQDLQVDAALQLGMMHGWMGAILYKLEAFLLRRADRVLTITDTMRQRIVQKGISKEKVWLFPNWADLQLVKPMDKNDNLYRKKLGIQPHQVLFVYSGNLGEKQGLELVMKAALILQEEETFQFLICGDGVARKHLKDMADRENLQNVHFLPVQPIESLSELLAAADVHLVIQKKDAADLVMPSKLTNILAAGRPTLATATSNTALYNVIIQEQLGLVVEPENLQAFVAAVRQIAQDSDSIAQMGVNARRYAERHLSKDLILSEFESNLKTLLSR